MLTASCLRFIIFRTIEAFMSKIHPVSSRKLRAQVAAEYLAIYGWALFAMFAVIAVLISSGMLSPGRFTSETCTFAPNLPCSGFYAAKTSTTDQISVNFNITNTQGFPIYIKNCAFSLVKGASVAYNGDPRCGGYVPQGGSVVYNVPLQSSVKVFSNDLRTVTVNLTFRNCQDAVGATQALQAADCQSGANLDIRFPLHNTSGQLVVQVRG